VPGRELQPFEAARQRHHAARGELVGGREVGHARRALARVAAAAPEGPAHRPRGRYEAQAVIRQHLRRGPVAGILEDDRVARVAHQAGHEVDRLARAVGDDDLARFAAHAARCAHVFGDGAPQFGRAAGLAGLEVRRIGAPQLALLQPVPQALREQCEIELAGAEGLAGPEGVQRMAVVAAPRRES
jgi:hypothetical protein